jgi:CRISPR system Cascade subunit CasE
MYLSRLTLKSTPSIQALQALFNPDDDAQRLDAHHRLVWSAFSGDPDATRDFLWREERDCQFLVLSPRPPAVTEVFEPPDTKPFAPELREGDRLAFMLRANATRTVKTARITASNKREREHRDIVMDLLRPVPKEERAIQRMELAHTAAAAWLTGVGAREGFLLNSIEVDAYRALQWRRRGGKDLRFGVLDMHGMLTVTQPHSLLARLHKGFGRAKAFGCGLMLIRRT